MRVLLIGGAGFIGSKTALRLHAEGHEPVILDSLDPQIHGEDPSRSPTVASLSGRVEIVRGDARDREAVDRALEGAEAVYYFPACTGTGQSMYEAERYCDVNVRAAGLFADALARARWGIRKVVVSSTRAVYGEGAAWCPEHGRVFPRAREAAELDAGRFEARCPLCGKPVAGRPAREDDPPVPVSIYGISKLAQEQTVACACLSLGIPCVIFRYQNVYGEGQSLKNPYTGILSIFTQLALGGRSIELFEDGRPARDFIHVDDIVEYNTRALEGPAGCFNVGTGEAATLVDLVLAIEAALGRAVAYRVSGRYRIGDIRNACADLDRLTRAFGPHRFLTLREGVRRFVEDVLARGAEPGAPERFHRSLGEMELAGLLRGALPAP